MNGLSRDDGIITVMLQRLKRQRLPHVFVLHEKVLSGSRLDDYDIRFLDIVYYEAKNCHSFCKYRPEYNDLFSRLVHLYKEIASAALENEKQKHSGE